MISSQNEKWIPTAIMAATVLGVLWFFFFEFGYSTGYMDSRSTLWWNMRQGYKMERGEWAFGYVVPVTVIALAWVTRDRFKGISPKASWLGLAVLALGFFVFFGGYKANEKYVGYISGQFLVAGFVLWFLGTEYFRRGFWLWILFGLTWPFIFLIEPVSVPLRKIMVVLTYNILQVIGEDVVRDGYTLYSAPTPAAEAGERFSLGIAMACSGLRSLFALGMVSILYGYLALEKGWHRLVLALSAVPFSIVGNLIRMLILYAGTLLFSKEFAIGKSELEPSGFHIGAGIMVFVVALICMLIEVQVLKRGLKALRRKRARVRKVDAGDVATNS